MRIQILFTGKTDEKNCISVVAAVEKQSAKALIISALEFRNYCLVYL
jgi:hypothetical protein